MYLLHALAVASVLIASSLFATAQSQAVALEVDLGAAEQLKSFTKPDARYPLPLGRIKLDRSSGRRWPEEVRYLDGALQTELWQLSNELTLDSLRQRLSDYFSSRSWQMLYQCQGRDCGESFSWANTVFKQALLYGNDPYQSLWVVHAPERSDYYVYYLVERPNGRQYLFKQTLSVASDQGDSLTKSRLLSGRLLLAGIPIRDGEPDFSALVGALAELDTINQGLLVIHRHGPALSLSLDDKLSRYLAEAGFTQFRVADVANLAPNDQAKHPAWVEWVSPDWIPGVTRGDK